MKAENIKVKFSPLVMAKIEYMCSLRTDKEWSGNHYYHKKVEGGEGEDSKVSIVVEDLAIMDEEGTPGFTTFNNDDTYALTYISRHRKLLGCQMGLLHSHHGMYSIGPSGTDDNTMEKEGKAPDVANFLSIIVYNDRKVRDYSVRITQRVKTKVLAGDRYANEFAKWKNEGQDTKTTFKDFEALEILDIKNIEYAEAEWTEAQKTEFVNRINELAEARKRKEEEEKRKKSYYYGNSGYGTITKFQSKKGKKGKKNKKNVYEQFLEYQRNGGSLAYSAWLHYYHQDDKNGERKLNTAALTEDQWYKIGLYLQYCDTAGFEIDFDYWKQSLLPYQSGREYISKEEYAYQYGYYDEYYEDQWFRDYGSIVELARNNKESESFRKAVLSILGEDAYVDDDDNNEYDNDEYDDGIVDAVKPLDYGEYWQWWTNKYPNSNPDGATVYQNWLEYKRTFLNNTEKKTETGGSVTNGDDEDTGMIEYRQLSLMLVNLSIMELKDPKKIFPYDIKVAIKKNVGKLKRYGLNNDGIRLESTVEEAVKGIIEALRSGFYAFRDDLLETLLVATFKHLKDIIKGEYECPYTKAIMSAITDYINYEIDTTNGKD